MKYIIFVTAVSFFQISYGKITSEFVQGEYLVKIKNEFSELSTVDLRQRLQVKKVKQINGPRGWVKIISKKKLSTLKKNQMIEAAEPNFIYRAELRPNDRRYTDQWGLKNTGSEDSSGNKGEADIDINVEKAWDVTTGSNRVVVAVIDTGVNFNDKDLAPNAWINEKEYNGKAGVDDDGNGFVDDVYGYDFVNNDGEPLDDNSHGTHCAGTIGARGNDGFGMAGVNWQVKIMPVKFLSSGGSGSLEDAINAIKYAVDNGAKILNNSWGGADKSQALEDVIKYANDRGVLFVASAGNDGNNSDAEPHYPSGYQVANVISVAAINNGGKLPDWSNYGKKTVHIAAPGENILSLVKDDGDYEYWSGTSMATPFVTGVAALSLAVNPSFSAAQLKAKILSSVKKMDGLANKVITGGIIDARGAL